MPTCLPGLAYKETLFEGRGAQVLMEIMRSKMWQWPTPQVGALAGAAPFPIVIGISVDWFVL